MKTLFVSDLHGNIEKYKKLFDKIISSKPSFVFIGGDLSNHLKTYADGAINNFYADFFQKEFGRLKSKLGSSYPEVFVIMGNDDPRAEEHSLFNGDEKKLWHYINQRSITTGGFTIYGYAYCPPSPFQLKDWEKYDVSRYVDPGCISPEEGIRTVLVSHYQQKHSTIQKDLNELVNKSDLSKSIFLFHTPPYKTNLDRAGLDNKVIDHAPVDVHVGSIAVKKLIEKKQPYLTLHGHIHESADITGNWKDKIGETICFNAAHNGKELSIISFDLDDLSTAKRILL